MSLINPEWDFQKMGIGGLDKVLNARSNFLSDLMLCRTIYSSVGVFSYF